MKSTLKLNRTFSVAPMMAWTTRHCRYFHRVLTKNALLYTEMVTTGALLHGDRKKFLQHNIAEYPLALQLGGSNIKELAQCAILAEQYGFQEVNLNVGCPSNRVQRGRIGACLMDSPIELAAMIKAMKNEVAIPVTIKHRIGITDRSSYEELVEFVGILTETDCDAFIIHAREAVLNGISAKLNREVPVLKYDWVYKIKQEFPQEVIVINGGIDNIAAIKQHLQLVDGVMLGREAYKNPYILAQIEEQIFNNTAICRKQIIAEMLVYIENELLAGTPIKNITKHMFGLFKSMPKGKMFRTQLNNLHISKTLDHKNIMSLLQDIFTDILNSQPAYTGCK